MNTLDFLKLVWPANGHYLILMPDQYQKDGVTKQFYKHFAFSTIDQAAAHAQLLTNQQRNVFFALASVNQDVTRQTKAQRDAAGIKTRGRHKASGYDNTCAVKAFWFDLDVKPGDPLAYDSQNDAATAIRGFVTSMGLPRPMITSSGGGFHVYWPLDREIDSDTWQHHAGVLKQLAEAWGLRADRSRTSDVASILRPAGTNNWKTGTARPVQVVVPGQPVDTTQFLARLTFMHQTTNLPAPQTYTHQAPTLNIAGTMPTLLTGVASINDEAMNGVGYEAPDPRLVVKYCQQLAWQANNQGSVSEPLWYAMVGCLRHADQGPRAVHFMSKQSPTYNPTTTDDKINQHVSGGYGPTRCETFAQLRPGGCDGCPRKGQISTPLQNVKLIASVPAPVATVQTAQGSVQVQLPPPPKPFKRVRNPMTGNHQLAMTQSDKRSGNEEDVVIYEYDMYPSKIIFDERTSSFNIVVNRWLPRDGWAEFTLPAGTLYDTRGLATVFGNQGILPDRGMMDEVIQYMIGYSRDLQKFAQSTTLYAQLGWRLADNTNPIKFVLPHKVISVNGSEPVTPSKNVVNALTWQDPQGSLEEWKKIPAMYERPGMEAHQFGFGVGFASPLFGFTNFSGMIVSLVGKRGAGKSSSAMTANSVWGHPKMGWADLEHDTMRAFYQKLGVLKNLPATYDEHTNLEKDVVSDLCYLVSKGQGRQRLKVTGEAQENHGTFQLMMLMTGNKSLNSRLAEAKADTSAESARVFEYEVPANTLTKQEADQYWGPDSLITKNFGLAGEVYAKHMLEHLDWAKERIKYHVQRIDAVASVDSGERFWSAGVACILTGFELSNQCGLTNVDIDRLMAFAVRVINDMRVNVTDNTRTSTQVLGEYMNNSLRSSLILNEDRKGNVLASVHHMPTDRMHVRIERYSGIMYIDRAAFRKYCGNNSIDARATEKELMAKGILLDNNVRIVMGKGTTLAGVQTNAWKLKFDHPDLMGLGQMVVVAAQNAPQAVAP